MQRFHHTLGKSLAALLLLVPAAGAQQDGRDLKFEAAPDRRSLPESGKRWALVVGVDQYDDGQITSLRGASNDAKVLAEAFKQYAGFPEDQVILLASDQPAERRPTRSNILVRLANLSKLVPADGLLLISFAGHGMERENQVFLLPSDAKMSNNVRVLQQTALNVTDIRDWIKEMGVKQVLMLLDACRNDPSASRSAGNNAMTEGMRRSFDFDGRNTGIEAFAVLYATRVGARAYEYTEKHQGYFTWAIAEALRGKAANDAGEVTLASLQRYVQDTVPRQVKIDLGDGVDQRPFADIRGYRAEELVIGRAGAPKAGEHRVEVEEWEKIALSRDLAELEAFRARHAGSPLAGQAMEKMAAIAWEKVKESRDPKTLRDYQAAYPASPFRQLAAKFAENLEGEAKGQEGVTMALARFSKAYGLKDAEQLKGAFPALGRKEIGAIESFFKMARSISLELNPAGAPRINGDTASVVCKRTLRFSDESGPQKPNNDSVAIRLKQRGDSWVIESIEPVK